jgi:uncharacterized protein (TIGR02246 family)
MVNKTLFIFLSFAFTISAQAQNQDEAAIKSFVNNFEQVFNKKDAKAIANFWAEDGDFVTYLGILLHGREEIEKYHQNIFVQFYGDAKNKLFEPTIRFIKPDVAAVDVRWEMNNATTSDGKPRPTFKGVMVWTLTKENGNWNITIMHNLAFKESK